jgi:hypothetical protein
LSAATAIVGRRHTAEQYADMLIDQFDEMKRRSRKAPLVFGMSLHTFIVGQPFRIVHLRRALEHMRANSEGVWWPLPRDIVTRLNSEIVKGMSSPAGRERLNQLAFDPVLNRELVVKAVQLHPAQGQDRKATAEH